MKQKYDWNALKCEYVTGDITAAELAKKHGINKNSVYRHCQTERWNEEKRHYLADVLEKCADKAAYIAAMRLSEEMDIAARLGEALGGAAKDAHQFNRYIVREKYEDGSTGTEEKLFDKLDMKSLSEAIKALTSLEALRRAMENAAKVAESEQAPEKEPQGGVVILPQIKEEL